MALLNAVQVFDESIAVAANPTTGRVYNNGVFYNKRVDFFVFRSVVFNLLCNKTGRDANDLFVSLTAGLPLAPSTFTRDDNRVRGDRRSSAGRLFIDLNTLFDKKEVAK